MNARKTTKPEADRVKARDRGTRAGAMHRLELVRQCQGKSRRDVARAMAIDLNEVKRQENVSTDLRLTEIYRWKKALDVPLSELLTSHHDPIQTSEIGQRRMVRMLNVASAIRTKTNQNRVRRLVQMLLWQFAELAPEMDGTVVIPSAAFGRNQSSHHAERDDYYAHCYLKLRQIVNDL